MRGLLGLCFLLVVSSAFAETVTSTFQQGVSGYTGFEDTSIFSESTNSGGATVTIFAGRNNSGNLRRALLKADLSTIPSNATITSVTLDLVVNNAPNTMTPNTYELHRVTADWDAGTVNATAGGGGSGAAANTGDATWASRNHNVTLWTTAGGDYDATVSASTTSGAVASTTTWTNGGLITDVQGWVDTPSTNFGWIIVGPETTNQRIRGFNSAEATSSTPKLTVVYNLPPSVSSIVRANTSLTNATSVDFTVTFSEGVTGVNAADFTVSSSGVTGASVTNVTGGATVYTVTVNTGTGDGTVRLDLTDDDTITSVATSLVLGDTGAGNGNFTTGETYTVDKTAPTAAIGTPSTSLTNTGPVTFTVTYGGASAVTLANGDVTLNATGGASGTIGVSGTGTATRTVTISGITGNGTLGITIASGTASDTVGNLASGAGPSTTFTVDNTAPTIALSSTALDPINSAISVTVLLSSSSADFDAGDVTPTNAAVSAFTGGGTSYSFTLTPSAQGAFSAVVNAGTFTDAATNANTASNLLSRTFDSIAPGVTVDLLNTNDSRPPLSGTVDDPDAVISVTVDGQTNPADNNGDGTWSLADNELSALAAGTYNVSVTATDEATNAGSDITTNELTIDLVISVSPAGTIHEGDFVELTGPTGGAYQWKKDGSNVVNDPPRVTGATSQTLQFDTVLESDSGSYTISYDDAARSIVESPPFVLDVEPSDALPIGATGLAVMAAGLVLAFVWRNRALKSKRSE